MGERLLLAARKSRKGDEEEELRYLRQEHITAQYAERDGHTIVATVRDTVSSQRPPWTRKNLKKWMTDPARMAMYDGLLVETDRLSRADDKGWHDIESWCYDHGKKIITTEGVQFPPRNDADRYQWVGLKRQSRTYWESVRDKHAQAREIVKDSGGIIGRPPFGYATAGSKYAKSFVPDPHTADVAREIFARTAAGESGAKVAKWLDMAAPRVIKATGRPVPWRVKTVLAIVRNRTYLGERDGVKFEALVDEKLWNDANATVAARSFTRGAPPTEHSYSGVIYCQCGAVLYRHKSERGREKYRCGRGRRGVPETRCDMPGVNFGEVNAAVDKVMRELEIPEQVQRAEGGDAGKAAELALIKRRMNAAMRANDMDTVAELSVLYRDRESREAAPVRVWWEQTGRSLGELWREGDVAEQRDLLGARGIGAHGYRLVVNEDATAELVLGPEAQ